MAAAWLRSRGHNVQLICKGAADCQTVDLQISRLPARCCPGAKLKLQIEFTRGLLHSRSLRRPGTIFYLQGHSVTPASLLSLVGVPRKRIIYQTLDFLEPGRHPHWELFERQVVRRAGWVICNEINRARFLASHYGLTHRPTVVPTALPKSWPRPRFDRELRRSMLQSLGKEETEASRLIMHEGGFAPSRCGLALIRALKLLPRTFILIFTRMHPGNHDLLDARRVIGQEGLTDRVLFLGRLDFKDLMRHTACCDVGMLLYPDDGIGNFYQCPGRLTHYLGCGLPVVASNFPGLELAILKHRLGATCDPTSPHDIARAIREVSENSDNRAEPERARLRAVALDELAYDRHASRIEDIINEITSYTG